MSLIFHKGQAYMEIGLADSLNRVGNVKVDVHNSWIIIISGGMEATSVLLAVHILTGNPIPH